MENLLKLLQGIHPLTPPLQSFLARTVKLREVSKKNMLLRAGHVCRHIFFVEQGLLRCYYTHGDNEVTSWFMQEGDVIISIESFFQQVPSYESIQALEDTILYYIDYNELQFIYREYAEFNFVGRVLVERYYQLWAQQLYGLRMKGATERYAWLLRNYPGLVLRVPSKFIASWLGMAEAHFSVVKGRRESR